MSTLLQVLRAERTSRPDRPAGPKRDLPFVINELRRRSPGNRVLAYLDQSTVSALATEERHAATRELLQDAVRAGKLICPSSLGHTDETLAAARSWNDILTLQDELSMGVHFYDEEQLVQRELLSALAEFLGEKPTQELWEEALSDDPQTPRDELFPGGMRVRTFHEPNSRGLSEVAHEKNKELALQAAYDQARALGRSFDEQAEAEFDAQVYRYLGAVSAPDRFVEDLKRREVDLHSSAEWTTEPGSPVGKFIVIQQRAYFVAHLADAYPALVGRGYDFSQSENIRHLPSMVYPPLFRAGIAVMRGRKWDRGDGHDIDHLTKALSRCDIATADGGMTQLARDRKLVPDGCTLLPFRDMDGLHRAIEAAVSAVP